MSPLCQPGLLLGIVVCRMKKIIYLEIKLILGFNTGESREVCGGKKRTLQRREKIREKNPRKGEIEVLFMCLLLILHH